MRPPSRDEAYVRSELARTRQFFDKSRPGRIARLSPVQEHVFAVTSMLIPKGRRDLKAVDLGCHWGRYTKVIAETYGDVTGVDVSEKAIATAETGNNIRYLKLDLDALDTGWSQLAPVNFFFANAVFEMLENPSRVCEQIAACGSPGAVILAIIPNRRSLNYVTFRMALWIATRLLRKRGGIYNNGITRSRLAASLEAAGFVIQDQGGMVGVPVYLLSLLPARAQRALLRLDSLLLWLIGGSYHWVMAKKAPHAGGRT